MLRRPQKIDKKVFNRKSDPKIRLYIKEVVATPPRIAIYGIFQKAFKPLCAENIMEIIKISGSKNISVATIYRSLEIFDRQKLIERIDTTAEKRNFYQIL